MCAFIAGLVTSCQTLKLSSVLGTFEPAPSHGYKSRRYCSEGPRTHSFLATHARLSAGLRREKKKKKKSRQRGQVFQSGLIKEEEHETCVLCLQRAVASKCITKINTATARSLLSENNTCIVYWRRVHNEGELSKKKAEKCAFVANFYHKNQAVKCKISTCKLMKTIPGGRLLKAPPSSRRGDLNCSPKVNL